MIKLMLMSLFTYIVALFTIIFLFIEIPDFYIDTLKDKNTLKRLMKNDSFKIIYIGFALMISLLVVVSTGYLGCYFCGIPNI